MAPRFLAMSLGDALASGPGSGAAVAGDPPGQLTERRAESRRRPDVAAPTIDVPGAVVLEVLDVSEHGLCCRLGAPVAPGRTGAVRVSGTRGAVRHVAQVVRCEVASLTAQRVEYRAAWRLASGWSGGL
jgi:hypothetical protein